MPAKIERQLRRMEGWRIEDLSLKKEFVFSDFNEAMDFMNRLVPVADKLKHHPDWSNSYNRVSISLTSHSKGGLTEKDFVLARAADQAAKALVSA